MDTDADGNGIPDEFEEAYNELAGTASQNDRGARGGSQVSEDEVVDAIEQFVDRIPVRPQTLRLKGHIESAFQRLQETSSPRRQEILLLKIQNMSDRMLNNDPVHAAAMQYLDDLRAADEPGAPIGQSGARGGATKTIEDHEDAIRRNGDIMFVMPGGWTPRVSWIWALDWSHVGLYAGSGQVYDSDYNTSFGCSNGVANRDISKFIADGNKIQYGELDNASGRSNVPAALESAQVTYGDDCETPYNLNFLNKGTDDKMYCSQLVWKTYKGIEDYAVDLDSNNWRYMLWLYGRYGPAGVAVGLAAVAPDEIARDNGDLDYYHKTRVEL